MATQELTPIRWAYSTNSSSSNVATVVSKAEYNTWYTSNSKRAFNFVNEKGFFLPIYDISNLDAKYINLELIGENASRDIAYECYVYGIRGVSFSHSSPTVSSSARNLIYQSSNSTGRFSYAINNFPNSTPISGSDGDELLQEEPYSYIGILGVFTSGDTLSVDVSSFSVSDTQGGGSDPTPKTIKISARPGSPSGNNVDWHSYITFNWSLQNSNTQGITYLGTTIQLTNVNDQNGDHLIFEKFISDIATIYTYTSRLDANREYIWRAIPSISGSPSNGDIAEVETSDWQHFITSGYNTASYSTELTSPDDGKKYTYGSTINLQWSVNKSSSLYITSTKVYIDNNSTPYKTITGSSTSLNLDKEQVEALGIGVHHWYVAVNVSSNETIDSISGSGISESRSFEIISNSSGVSVTANSPSDYKQFIKGDSNNFTFQWSTNGFNSGVTITGCEIYIDNEPFKTIDRSTTSYSVTKADIDDHPRLFSVADHSWYVNILCNVSAGTVLNGSTRSYPLQYFKIINRVATATPSSPGNYNSSTSVDARVPITFRWTLSQSGSEDGKEEYSGSELQWRYSTSEEWQALGKVQKNINEFTYEPGFEPHTVVHWRVKAGIGGRPGTYPENLYATFEVGDEVTKKVTLTLEKPRDSVNGTEPIEFIWTAKRDGAITGTQLEYSIDGKKTWINPEKSNNGVIYGDYDTYSKTYTIPNLPADTIYWRVRAKTNSDYGDWVESSFKVTYSAIGRVRADASVCPISQGFRYDYSSRFAAGLTIDGTTTENIVFKDAQFCWKMANGSDYATEEMTVNGKQASISFKGHKFSNGILYWYIKATDSKDNETATILYTSYVLKSAIDSFAIKPKLTYIDMAQQIPFEWGFIAANGQASIATEICFSKDGKDYSDIISITNATIHNGVIDTNSEGLSLTDLYTATGSYFFEANHFSPGIVYWKVRSKSSDSVFGEWSEPTSFIITGTSQPLDFACDEKPFAKLTWSVSGQMAYQIRVDDAYSYGPFHGEDQSFTFPEPLLDGTHTLSVRSQNQLGSWGNWSSIFVFILNQPSTPGNLKLTIDADVDAVLHWNPVIMNADDEFLVYRDNKLVARLTSGATSYMDRLALGSHKYRVVQKLPDGNYNLYTRSVVNMSTEVTKISLLKGGSWVDLLLTSEQYPQNTFSHSRIVEKSKIMGAKHQVIEISEFEENSGEYKFCWPYYLREQSKLFDSLVGQAVIIKSRGEQVICGVLESCSMTISSQIVECDFSLEQMSTDADLSIAVRPEDTLDMMTNLDTIYFGQMNSAELAAIATNPGYTDPRWYEDIAEAINEKLAESERLTRKTSDMSSGV